MRYITVTILSLVVLFVCAFSADRARAQQPPVVTIPPIHIPPIAIPGIDIPPITIPPIEIPPVVLPPAPASSAGGPATSPASALSMSLPPQTQAIFSCIEGGGSGLGVAACIAESQGQDSTAQTLRSIDACTGDGGSDIETAACIAEAAGQEEAAQTLRAIDGCLAAGGADDEITACVAGALGISITVEQAQSARTCGISSTSSSTNSASSSSGDGSTSTTSSSSNVQVASCTGAVIESDATAQALLGCFSGAEGAAAARLVACAVGTMPPELATMVERVFACIEGYREDGDLNSFLTCAVAATAA
ncbi:MAG: hypothetical protein AB7R89_08555 [Dehalococcoidia bacterium]